MPTYKVTDPTSGQTLRLTGDSPPTEEELNDIFSKVTSQTTQPQTLEQRTSQRPDIYGQAVQSFQQLMQPQQKLKTPFEGLTQIPDIALKSLGGIVQRGEATIANPFIEMGRGQFGQMLPSIRRGITGEQLGELGDVARQAGIPEPISAGLGLVGSGMLMNLPFKIANNLTKIQTTYGKDIGKNVIRFSTGMPDVAVEHGMRKGWKKILTKENLDPTIPTRLSQKVLNSLDDIARQEYDDYGRMIDKLDTGNIKAIDLNQTIENSLMKNGYLNPDYSPTLKVRGTIVNKIFDFIDKAKSRGIKPDENIPVAIVRNLKQELKKMVPEKNWIGKIRSLRGEQKLAKQLSYDLNSMVGYNAFGIEDETYTMANRRYSEFKNFEKAILDTFSETVGQETKPTADRIVGLFDLHPTKANEELIKLFNIDNFLKSKGYGRIYEPLMDWLTTQSAVVKPQQGGASLYPFRVLAESTKYGARQLLKSGITSPIGQGIEAMGRFIQPTRQIVNRQTIIPPSILRQVTGRNQ